MSNSENKKIKILRVTTVPISMNILMHGQLKFMSQFFEMHGATSYDEKHFNEVAVREGVTMHQVDLKRTISPFSDLKALFQLYKLIRKEKPTIVHTHTPKAGLLGMMAAKLAGTKIRLHTVAGMPLVEASGVKLKILSFLEKLTYACATRVYPNSYGLQKIILDKNLCDSSKLKVLGNGSSNGIDTNRFKSSFNTLKKEIFRKQIGIDSTDFVYGFVGRIGAEKGISELVQAFIELQNQGISNIKLLLVGPLENNHVGLSDDIINQMQSNPSILAVGRHDNIVPYLEASDCFVFPSYREGFPNVVLQAGAVGLPCIVSDINGCNEIVIEEYNGLIVPVKNIPNLKNAMLKLFTDGDMLEKFGRVARENIVKKYEKQEIWNAILTEYNQQLTKYSI